MPIVTCSYDAIVLNSSICTQLAQYGVSLKPSCLLFGPLLFNCPISLNNNVQLCKVTMDAYSSINQDSSIVNSSIGRYCSIAHEVEFGLAQHELTNFTSSDAVFTQGPFEFYAHIPRKYRSNIEEKNNSSRMNPVTIKHDVWIGAHTIIPAEVTIGTGAVIGAGSVITHDVPPYSVVVGNNRIIRQRFSDEICADLLESKWWLYDIPKMLERGDDIPMHNPRAFLDYINQSHSEDLLKIQEHWQYLMPAEDESCKIAELNADGVKELSKNLEA